MFTKEEAMKKIAEALDEGNENCNWCGCYEGDFLERYPAQREKVMRVVEQVLDALLASK